ncbi:MAG: ATP-binding protein [Oscillospiraceae bacterium]
MSINEQYFNAAMARLEQRRSYNKSESERRRDEVYEKLPEYQELAEHIAQTGQKLVSLIMNRGETAQGVAELEKDNLDAQRCMAELLKNAGYPADYLKPVYTCPKCHDKGTVDGKWCGCFQRLMMEEAARELNENSPLELSSFDSFRLDYYPETIDPTLRISERKVMETNLERCRKYAENFTLKSEGILMCGATGLGKTHLSLAIASSVMEKGYNVIYGSSPELLRIMEREYFGKSDADTMSALTGCDLLILDDLGAEMEKPLYESLLYELINSRISRGLPMIVSTNYSTIDLRKHYPDKICSRLLSLRTLMFVGNDIRVIIKKNK